jgi:hypothetical protein
MHEEIYDWAVRDDLHHKKLILNHSFHHLITQLAFNANQNRKDLKHFLIFSFYFAHFFGQKY